MDAAPAARIRGFVSLIDSSITVVVPAVNRRAENCRIDDAGESSTVAPHAAFFVACS
jgi:hypothetical protein